MDTSLRERLDPNRHTVHDLVRLQPAAASLLQGFGIDTCCGGELSVAEAARRHGVALDELFAALEGAERGTIGGP